MIVSNFGYWRSVGTKVDVTKTGQCFSTGVRSIAAKTVRAKLICPHNFFLLLQFRWSWSSWMTSPYDRGGGNVPYCPESARIIDRRMVSPSVQLIPVTMDHALGTTCGYNRSVTTARVAWQGQKDKFAAHIARLPYVNQVHAKCLQQMRRRATFDICEIVERTKWSVANEKYFLLQSQVANIEPLNTTPAFHRIMA